MSLDNRFLILHMVRGEPEFDIALQLDSTPEIWIIPTSGHRAYPLWTNRLDHISYIQDSDPHAGVFQLSKLDIGRLLMPDWPDHYPAAQPSQRGPGVVVKRNPTVARPTLSTLMSFAEDLD